MKDGSAVTAFQIHATAMPETGLEPADTRIMIRLLKLRLVGSNRTGCAYPRLRRTPRVAAGCGWRVAHPLPTRAGAMRAAGASYSDRPAASRASSGVGNPTSDTAIPSRIVQMCPFRYSNSPLVPPLGRRRLLTTATT